MKSLVRSLAAICASAALLVGGGCSPASSPVVVESTECGVLANWIKSSGLSVPWENNLCCMEKDRFGMWRVGGDEKTAVHVLCKHQYEGHRIVWFELDGIHETEHKLGDVPEELADLTKLRVLHVPNNNIGRIGQSLSRMHRLVSVDFSGNPIRPGTFLDGVFSVQAELLTCDLAGEGTGLLFCDEDVVPDACLRYELNKITKGWKLLSYVLLACLMAGDILR
ncbi:hypothetical protein HDU93_006505 [Gonapodya sp. JEL0774]|nr:hypothetical protein HDU93_006505 [Gonapodya sp. JEL0774]